jgi:hypothetical protein
MNDELYRGGTNTPLGKYDNGHFVFTPSTPSPVRHEATGCGAWTMVLMFGTICFLSGLLIGLWF